MIACIMLALAEEGRDCVAPAEIPLVEDIRVDLGVGFVREAVIERSSSFDGDGAPVITREGKILQIPAGLWARIDEHLPAR
jgi:hypothetical protein